MTIKHVFVFVWRKDLFTRDGTDAVKMGWMVPNETIYIRDVKKP